MSLFVDMGPELVCASMATGVTFSNLWRHGEVDGGLAAPQKKQNMRRPRVVTNQA